jgi:DUF438 domain-containing protein
LKNPVVLVDTQHIIRYLNKAAVSHYREGASLLGTSIMDCHNETSCEMIREIFAAMKDGEEERLITDDEKHRIYMRAVRGEQGGLIGYYERYEPPIKRPVP